MSDEETTAGCTCEHESDEHEIGECDYWDCPCEREWEE